jgi:uncharacterized membrane protein
LGSHAFLYKTGKLLNLASNSDEQSEGYDVDDQQRRAGGWMYELNRLTSACRGLEMYSAEGINDSGQIVGYGWAWGQKRIRVSFLLTPIAGLPP